jgi:hypothetical protein
MAANTISGWFGHVSSPALRVTVPLLCVWWSSAACSARSQSILLAWMAFTPSLRKLARRRPLAAQHLRALSPLRRRATLIATVLDTITRLIDDTVTGRQ